MTLLWSLALVYLAIGFVSIGIDTALHFAGSAIDGPFQLHNAVRRILDGQRVGVDFQFFHGPAVPYLHVPVALLFGGGFAGSEIARETISIAAFLLSFLAIFRGLTGSMATAAKLTVIGTALAIVLRTDAIIFAINSILGLRSAAPLLFAAVWAGMADDRRRTPVAGLILGIGLLLGTEQALAMIAAFAWVQLLRWMARREAWRSLLREGAAVGGVAAAVVALFLLVAGGPRGLVGALRYNLSTVPKDQFWYFGGPPNQFVYRLAQLGVYEYLLIGAIVLAIALTARGWWRRRGDVDARETRVALVSHWLAVYALVSLASMLGTYSRSYAQPAVRVLIILASTAALGAVASPAGLRRVGRSGPVLLLGVVVAIGLYMRGRAMSLIARAPMHVMVAHLGPAGVTQEFSRDWTEARTKGAALVSAARARFGRPPVIWSTYSTIIEEDARLFHPSSDYIIHALGPDGRATYERDFASSRPDIVQTLRPRYTPYEEWLATHHWGFYRELFRDYRIVDRTPWSYLWVRRDAPNPDSGRVVAEGRLPAGMPGIELQVAAPADSLTLLEVSVWYTTHNPWRAVPIVGGVPRFLIEITGAGNRTAASLAPYAGTKTFPVIVRGPSSVRMVFRTLSLLPGASFSVDSTRIVSMPIPEGAGPWLDEYVGQRLRSPALP